MAETVYSYSWLFVAETLYSYSWLFMAETVYSYSWVFGQKQYLDKGGYLW